MEVIMAIATLAIAGATIFYTYYSHKQWKVMTETLNQSRAALDATIENFRLDQRAWVGPIHVILPEYVANGKQVYIKEGQPMKIGVFVANSGKTPALKVKNNFATRFLKAGDEFDPNDHIKKPSIQASSVLQPGMNFSLKPLPEGNSSKSDVDDLTSGRYILYMFGLITYEDIFGRPHTSKFCLSLSPDLQTFTSCSIYNEAD